MRNFFRFDPPRCGRSGYGRDVSNGAVRCAEFQRTGGSNGRTADAAASDDFVRKLSDADVKSLLAYWKTHTRIPPEFDGRLLTRCRDEIQRNLDVTEKKLTRRKFVEAIHARAMTKEK